MNGFRNYGFRNFGSLPRGGGWRYIGGGAWEHPGPLHWEGGTQPIGGITITLRPPPVKPWSPPPPSKRQLDISRYIDMRRAMEQAQRQAEQARAREGAAREARERAARERQRQEQQQRLHEQMQRLQREQRQIQREFREQQGRQLEQQRGRQRRLQDQLDRQRQQQEQLAKWQQRMRQLEIKDKPLESPLIDPIDLIIGGGIAARGLRVGSRQGASMLARVGNWILGRRSTSALSVAAKGLVAHCRQTTGRVIVNLAGAGEVPGAINVNNLAAQQIEGVPNLLRATVERIGDLFAKGSVDAVVSNNVVHGTVDWATTAAGCFKILRPRGQVSIAPYVAGNLTEHLDDIVAAFRAAGFREVAVVAGRFVTAVRP
jgi:hypothetical protein